MAVKHPNPFSNSIASACCIFLFISTASAYDGPAGVTFRAPCISKSACRNVVLQEGISVRVKVRIDNDWSLKVDGKGRAFPDQFIATIADSEITFNLLNQSGQKVTTSILIPFDASNTTGTGFTEPFSMAAFLNDRPVGVSRGPELQRGMMKVRSYRVPVVIPARSTVKLRITASHPLAVNPSWYQFICTDRHALFPDFRSLTTDGCSLEFEFDSADERLKEKPLKLELKKASHKELFTEQKNGAIEFRGESIQWVRVDR